MIAQREQLAEHARGAPESSAWKTAPRFEVFDPRFEFCACVAAVELFAPVGESLPRGTR